jgi:Ser/Thr protein kinase RdoA (MazF antagonist)
MRAPIDETERDFVFAALEEFGIAEDAVTGLALLTGGLLSRVIRVDVGDSAYALKEYWPADTAYGDLQLICDAQDLVRRRGIPVPETVHSVAGSSFVETAGRLFVLSRFVEGGAYEPDLMPVQAARRLGETLAQLQAALASLPAGEPPAIWSHRRIEAYLDGLLRAADRDGTPTPSTPGPTKSCSGSGDCSTSRARPPPMSRDGRTATTTGVTSCSTTKTR